MESNLATIDRAFHDVALAEKDDPRVTDKIKAEADKVSKSVIAGFDITNDEAKKGHIEKAKESRRSNIIKYLEKRSSFHGELNKLGVEPLAVLPSKAWGKLCKDAGLFFISTTTGKVQCRYKTTSGEGAWGWMNSHHKTPNTNNEDVKNNHRVSVAQEYVKKNKYSDILEEFATDRWFYEGTSARIILPPAPSDVIQTLIKVKALSPKTAAVPDAIEFAGGAAQVIADMHKGVTAKDDWARAQGYADYKEWLRLDPIIYVEKDGVAAIVAQFGAFPIEQELVEKVSHEDFFPEIETQSSYATSQLIYQQAQNFQYQPLYTSVPYYGGIGIAGGAGGGYVGGVVTTTDGWYPIRYG